MEVLECRSRAALGNIRLGRALLGRSIGAEDGPFVPDRHKRPISARLILCSDELH